MPDNTEEEIDYENRPLAFRAYRIEQAADQLLRYGGTPWCDEIADALDYLASLNDDLCHMRHIDCIVEEAEKIKTVIDKIVELAEARG